MTTASHKDLIYFVQLPKNRTSGPAMICGYKSIPLPISLRLQQGLPSAGRVGEFEDAAVNAGIVIADVGVRQVVDAIFDGNRMPVIAIEFHAASKLKREIEARRIVGWNVAR
jgi:hypothetical protein